MRGQFDPKPPTVNTDGVEVEHPPFLSQAKVSLCRLSFIGLGDILEMKQRTSWQNFCRMYCNDQWQIQGFREGAPTLDGMR